MSRITRFTIQKKEAQLLVEYDQDTEFTFSFEYLRVFTPSLANPTGKNLVSHKKNIKIIKIESVGKHGYRLCFDDDHSAIYSTQYFITLHKEHDIRWQHYLADIANSAHSRDASISIKQL